ncbi:MAG: hypothetical protein ACYS8L_05210 [Planctomycetota bacterium]|jgi:hypothetical protein
MKPERKHGKRMPRRRFLKAAAGALAVSAVPTIVIPRRVEAYQPGGKIHPNIGPLRVVGLTDARMTAAPRLTAPWQETDPLVASDAVRENMDKLAMALAEEGNAADAWKKIFVKPAGRSWPDVVVGIKTNQTGYMRSSVPVMSKVCHVLTDIVGVRAPNIHIYDACTGGDGGWGSAGVSNSIRLENRYADLPEGVHLADRWGGVMSYRTAVPEPYMDGEQRLGCLAHLVANRVGILINIALCKHDRPQFGGFTLCLKNHFATFNPLPAHEEGGGADYPPEILGRMDARSGNVLHPRQQLCIIDALWASNWPGGGSWMPTAQPNALFMGAFAPSLDYLVATRFLGGELGWPIQEDVTGRLLADFGFASADLPNGGQILDAMATSA